MDHSTDQAHIKTFAVVSQMMPCEICDLSHLLFPLITMPLPLSVTVSCYRYYCCYSLVYSDPYSVCDLTHLIHLLLLHFFCSLCRASVTP